MGVRERREMEIWGSKRSQEQRSMEREVQGIRKIQGDWKIQVAKRSKE